MARMSDEESDVEMAISWKSFQFGEGVQRLPYRLLFIKDRPFMSFQRTRHGSLSISVNGRPVISASLSNWHYGHLKLGEYNFI